MPIVERVDVCNYTKKENEIHDKSKVVKKFANRDRPVKLSH